MASSGLSNLFIQFYQRSFDSDCMTVPSVYRSLPMGQQHRVTVKRKRRRAYVERKKAKARVSARPAPKAKTRAKKEAAPAAT
jgi:hypothetical protein